MAKDLLVGDTIPVTNLPAPVSPLSPPLLDDVLVGWIIGFYLAEGYQNQDGSKTMFSIHASEIDCFDRIRNLAESLGNTSTFRLKEGNSAVIAVYGRLFGALMREYICGETCYNKRLTTKAWQRNNEFLLNVVNGYLDGDGHWDEKNERWRLGFCNNDGLATDLRTLAARVDSRLRLRRTVHTGFGKKFPGWRGEWRHGDSCKDSSQGDIIAIRSARSRFFWDIEVADNPNTFALASGLLTHNSPMPESVKDRPAKALEYVFLFSKVVGEYYYDNVAIRKKSVSGPASKTVAAKSSSYAQSIAMGRKPSGNGVLGSVMLTGAQRNFWQADLWFESVDSPHGLTGVGDEILGIDVTSEPYPDAHFATYPRNLIRPFLKAGTSEYGACGECDAPWRRVTETTKLFRGRANDYVKRTGEEGTGNVCPNTAAGISVKTIGWEPTCGCFLDQAKCCRMCGASWAREESANGEGIGTSPAEDGTENQTTEVAIGDMPCSCFTERVKPCTVLDPFIGSATTALVTMELGLNCWGIDLSEEYLGDCAVTRIEKLLGESREGKAKLKVRKQGLPTGYQSPGWEQRSLYPEVCNETEHAK